MAASTELDRTQATQAQQSHLLSDKSTQAAQTLATNTGPCSLGRAGSDGQLPTVCFNAALLRVLRPRMQLKSDSPKNTHWHWQLLTHFTQAATAVTKFNLKQVSTGDPASTAAPLRPP